MISLTPKARPLIAPAPVATGNPRQLEGALNAQPQTPIGAPTAAPQQPLSLGPGGASDYQKLLAAQLMREGGSTAPVRTGYEGLGRMGQALSGAFLARDAQKKDQTQAQALAQMLQGGIGGADMDPAMAGIIQAVAGQDPMAAAQMAGSVINQRAASQAAAQQGELDFQRKLYIEQMKAGVPQGELERLLASTDLSDAEKDKLRRERLTYLTTKQDAPSTTVINALGKPPAGYQWGEDGLTLEKIEGGPADQVSGETAGRAAMTEQGGRDISRYREMLINPDGSVNRTLLATQNAWSGGVPFTQGRTASSLIENAIAAKLRLETGAAATAGEVENMMNRFAPSVFDDDAAVKNKIDRLEEFMGLTGDAFSEGMTAMKARPAAGAASPAQGLPTVGAVVDGYRFKGGDPNSQSSWEKVQ